MVNIVVLMTEEGIYFSKNWFKNLKPLIFTYNVAMIQLTLKTLISL